LFPFPFLSFRKEKEKEKEKEKKKKKEKKKTRLHPFCYSGSFLLFLLQPSLFFGEKSPSKQIAFRRELFPGKKKLPPKKKKRQHFFSLKKKKTHKNPHQISQDFRMLGLTS